MPGVFVHGNPETDAIWEPLLDALGRDDVITLSPPGFGAPVADGFGATSDDYVAWLLRELAAINGPIDLVGHDWGGGHVMRAMCQQPADEGGHVRSWCIDIAGCFDPGYVWHDNAQLWQTPGIGEETIAAILAVEPAVRAKRFASFGMSDDVAMAVASAFDATMGECILRLYRSAAQPAMAMWGKSLGDARGRPGLVIIPTEDNYTGGVDAATRSAHAAGASITLLDGLGHWWMLEDPHRGAEALREFWSSLS